MELWKGRKLFFLFFQCGKCFLSAPGSHTTIRLPPYFQLLYNGKKNKNLYLFRFLNFFIRPSEENHKDELWRLGQSTTDLSERVYWEVILKISRKKTYFLFLTYFSLFLWKQSQFIFNTESHWGVSVSEQMCWIVCSLYVLISELVFILPQF